MLPAAMYHVCQLHLHGSRHLGNTCFKLFSDFGGISCDMHYFLYCFIPYATMGPKKATESLKEKWEIVEITVEVKKEITEA